MDAVEFMKEWQRMCDVTGCEDCSIKESCVYGVERCMPCDIRGFKSIVSGVEQWSKEHPRKTRLQDFIEKFPSAPLVDGIPERFCPYDLGYNVKDCKGGDKCIKCWNEPV